MKRTLRQALIEGETILWEITKDHIGDGDLDGLSSSFGQPIFRHDYSDLMVHKFRLYDDDGELYYEGVATNQDCESAFEPLDWGMANDGCTDIQYLTPSGKWESL